MGFEELLPDNENNLLETKVEKTEKISPLQVYDVITSKKPDWQQIIYDLINSEQLDPWDIDLVVLTRKYFLKISELEEAEYYISSKVLLAAALLLRIKSEFLLNRYIKDIDEILFGRKDSNKYETIKIEIDETELPILIPKTPMSRLRKVTLPELMAALNKAINTETRRIKKEVEVVRAKKLSEVDFPEFRRIDLKDRIRQFYAKILTNLKKKAVDDEKHNNKLNFFDIAREKDEKLACFLPLLHLSNSKKLWVEQEKHLDPVWIYLYNYFDKNRDMFIEELENEVLDELSEEEGENLDKLDQVQLVGEIEQAIRDVEAESKAEEKSGFSQEQ